MAGAADQVVGRIPDDRYGRVCPVCHIADPRNHCEYDGVCFVRCGKCRSLYFAAEPDWAALAERYQSSDYHQARGHGDDTAVAAAKTATTLAYLKLLERVGAPGRRYLEVGCSAGISLAAAAAAGWDVQGVEVSGPAAALARQRRGVGAVYTGTLIDAPVSGRSFDVVCMFDVIEHIDPPQPTIERAYRVLREGGLLLLVTPDGDSLSARGLGSHWPHLFADHVICFSRDGMRCLLREAGFEVLRVGFAWKRVNLDMLIRHARLHPSVIGSRGLRLLGAVLPGFLLRWTVPFNVGEFYAVARRPLASAGD